MPLGVAFSGPPSWLTQATKRECSSGVQRRRGLPAAWTAAAACWEDVVPAAAQTAAGHYGALQVLSN